jgi:uncharacterized damage-inducible protein DinB
MTHRECFERTWRARARLLAACAKLPRSLWRKKVPFSYGTLHTFFAHIIEVELSWMQDDVLGGKYVAGFTDGGKRYYWTPAKTLARGRSVAAVTRRALRAYATPSRLREKRRIPRWQRKGFETVTVDQILTHVYTHELRHQGQIQSIIRYLGKTPPNADWI